MCRYNETWEKIIKVHQYAKSLSLKAEEFDSHLKTFLQPAKEQRDACEHIIRAMAGKFNLRDAPSDDDYILSNLDKALGHEYRAFFDTADWLGITIREKIQNMLAPYNNTCLTEVIPDYYKKIRPRIENITDEIAKIRESKDIPSSTDILPQVEEYKDKIQLLFEDYKTLIKCIPSLEEYKKKDKKSNLRTCIQQIFIGIVIGILLVFITPQLSCQPNKNEVAQTQPTATISVSH